MSSLSCLHTSCRGYLIPGSTRLIVQYCKHVISRSTTSDDLFVDTTLMATQSLTEENSDLSENEDVQEIEDPILVAVNAGASLRSPTSAVIARKRKLPANEGKYKQRGSSKTTVRTSAWDRITEYPKHHSAVVNRKLRCNDTLPHWSSLVKKLLLIQPSSASAERVFSLLTNAFGSQQESALQDYLEASVMLRYNNAKRV